MSPSFNINKIKFATDPPTFEKAVALYERGKVKKFREEIGTYSVIVEGGKAYHVSAEARRFGYGHCNCYLGEQNILCKHLIAVAIHATLDGKSIPQEYKKLNSEPQSSGKLGKLSKNNLANVKKSISNAMKHIKPYDGPSRTWFAYQSSLLEGCHRLSAIISEFPVDIVTADLLVNVLLRLDKKLCTGGVDDSDGIIGGFIEEAVQVLKEYAKLDGNCVKAFEKLCEQGTYFSCEESLIKLS